MMRPGSPATGAASRRGARYAVELRLNDDVPPISLADIVKWVDCQKVRLPVFRYQTTARDAILRLEFENSRDAEEFEKAFPGAALCIEAFSQE